MDSRLRGNDSEIRRLNYVVEKKFMPEHKTVPKILWHKCNSVAMFLQAVKSESDGISGIEFDILATKDLVPLLYHDKCLQDGTEISSLSFAELQNHSQKIDTLEDAFAAISKHGFSRDFEFHLEIKPDSNQVWDAVHKILKKYPAINHQTIPRSFQENVVIYIKNNEPKRPVCLLFSGLDGWDEKKEFLARNTAVRSLEDISQIMAICGGIKPEYVSVNYRLLNYKFIENMKKNGVKLDIFTLNDIKHLGDFQVDSIVSDNPLEILRDL